MHGDHAMLVGEGKWCSYIRIGPSQHSLHCICCVAQRMLTVGSTTPLLVTEAVE